MKKEQFEFNELPYPTLARFGLTQEMIEDLPLCCLLYTSDAADD